MPRTVIDLFTEDDASFSSCVSPSKYKNVDLISSHIDLFVIGEQLSGNPNQIIGLKNKLDQGALDNYDYIIIDCPPALGGPFVNNALVISNFYLIPLESESFFALKGVQQFLQAVKIIKKTINPQIQLLGVLITMADFRTNVTKAMIDGINKFFGQEDVFETIITRNTAINKATMARKTVIDYDSRMQGAHDYKKFAGEFIQWVKAKELNH